MANHTGYILRLRFHSSIPVSVMTQLHDYIRGTWKPASPEDLVCGLFLPDFDDLLHGHGNFFEFNAMFEQHRNARAIATLQAYRAVEYIHTGEDAYWLLTCYGSARYGDYHLPALFIQAFLAYLDYEDGEVLAVSRYDDQIDEWATPSTKQHTAFTIVKEQVLAVKCQGDIEDCVLPLPSGNILTVYTKDR